MLPLDYTLTTVAMGAALLGAVAPVLGVFAVLRRQSLVGDMLGHAALPGICAGFAVAGARELGWLMAGALAAGAVAALLSMALTRTTRIKGDAALGIALALFFAGGIVMLTRIQASGGASQAGLESFLFGQAAAVSRGDLAPMAIVGLLAWGALAVGWPTLKAATFDPVFARSAGLPVAVVELALAVLIALAIVIGLQMVGVVLMSAMVVAPAAAARQWARSLGAMVVLAGVFGVVAGVAGALVSARSEGLATGPLIVLAASLITLVSILFAPGRGVVWEAFAQAARARRLEDRRVLGALGAIADAHDDPRYPAEETMVDALFGHSTRPALRRLEALDLVAEAEHMPEEGRHWRLTPAGRAQSVPEGKA